MLNSCSEPCMAVKANHNRTFIFPLIRLNIWEGVAATRCTTRRDATRLCCNASLHRDASSGQSATINQDLGRAIGILLQTNIR